MPALNYYVGVKRGDNANPFKVTSGTTSAGTGADVEIRMQLNDGTNAIGLTRKDVHTLSCVLLDFIESGGFNHAGANLPPL